MKRAVRGRRGPRSGSMMSRLSNPPVLIVACALAVTTPLVGQTYDPAAAFEQGWTAKTNPSGVWSYGYSSGFTTPITLYTQTLQNGINGPNAQFWVSPSANIGNSPAAEFNNGPAFSNGNVDFLAHQFILVAGIGGQYSDLVFTAPVTGSYSIASTFRGDQHGIGTVVGVVVNGTLTFSSSITAVEELVPFSSIVTLQSGSTVVFSAGPGGGVQNTGLSLTITGPATGLQITSSGTLPGAVAGQPYNATLGAIGGSFTGYSWSVSAGSLPAGFTLSAAGVLSSTGDPAATPRSYVFTAQVTDSEDNSATAILSLQVTTAANQSCVAPPSGIIAWWPFDETGGTGANDIVGGNLGAYVNSPTPASGEVGGALSLTGSNYVGVPDSNLWDFGAQDFTIELWANFPAAPGGSVGEPGAVLVGHDQGGGPNNKWFFAVGGGELYFTVYNTQSPPPAYFLALSPFEPVPGQWYHLAVTKAGTTFTIYVNGVAMGSSVSPSPIADASAPLTIGQAEDIGFMKGIIDELSIYGRALSPTDLASIANAGRAGKCKELTITTPSLSAVESGVLFSQQLQASFGQTPYAWSLIGGSLPTGVTLSPAGVLSGTVQNPGSDTFTVGVTDSAGSQAQKELTLTDAVTLPPPALRITKTGTLAVPGRTSDYFILVENIGTTTATNVPVIEFLQMQNFILLSVSPPALAGVSTLADAFIIPWNIPSLAPGQSTILSYTVQVNPTVPIGQIVTGTACLPQNIVPVLSDAAMCADGAARVVEECQPCETPCGETIALCSAAEFDLPLCLSSLASCGACLATGCLAEVAHLANDCSSLIELGRDIQACSSHQQPTLGAIDPNQKNVNTGEFIRPSQLLVYPIHYENIGTAAAQNVYVTDVLDPSLDASTLEILTPGGGYNPATRTITWNLLNTNLQPGATADVLFSIRPLQNLASGTTISNTATIKFDVFAPMTTNLVANVIDTTPPVSTMGPVPPQTSLPNFILTWSGTDEIGSIATYTIFESVNGGPFTPYLENTTSTQTSFTGIPGNTYGFISIATDTAGNVEVKPPTAEAAILVLPQSGAQPPLLSVVKQHTGPFAPGHQGAAYSVVVANAPGASPTVGLVTVTEAPPADMTLATMSGSGWTCSTNTCQRNDALPGGASYPAISVTVNVASNAPSPLINQVTVSGGSAPTAVANDPATITAGNACDVGNAGTVNIGDIQLMINETLGLAAPDNDLSQDNAVTVVDVQIVIDAAMGAACLGG